MNVESPTLEMVERLRRHRTLSRAPERELQWLAAHGGIRRFEAGAYVARQGTPLKDTGLGLEVILAGRITVYQDRGGTGSRKMIEFQAGEVTGWLPFSRMKVMMGNSMAETALELFSLSESHFGELLRECPEITASCVHALLDRARVFKATDLQDEKMVSLGKLTAGLAHELNNPASAVARSARLLQTSMTEADRAARALARAGLTREQLEAVDRVRAACMAEPPTLSMSPLERADREDMMVEWLEAHGVDDSAAEGLAATSVTVDALDALAECLEGAALDAALDWVAAGCAVRTLALESERGRRSPTW